MARKRPSGNRGVSGNPARAAQTERSIKQQREDKRQEKTAEYQRLLRRRQRGKLVWWAVGGLAVVVAAVLVIWSFLTAPSDASYDIDSRDGSAIEGVETFDNGTDHVNGEVDYPQSPPAGGPHNQIWLNCGIYTEPQQNENAVHSLEHGAVWITYDAEKLSDAEVETLREYLPSEYGLMSPYEGMDTPIALSAWNAQLKLDSVDDERITQFFEAYWRSPDVPEPGASCTGALDGPGKL